MLQNWPIEPFGHDGSFALSIVHSCEHTLWPSMSKLFVQGLPMHSLDVSETVVHVAPNVPGAGPPASGPGGGVLPEQAQRTNDQARRSRCMTSNRTADPFELM